MSYSSLKLFHIICVAISVSGFSLRALAMWVKPDALESPWVKRLPHMVDTLLFASGLGLLYITSLSPLQVHWLGLKLLLLIAYIVLGAFGLRYASGRRQRLLCCIAALTCVLAMIWLATTKPFIF